MRCKVGEGWKSYMKNVVGLPRHKSGITIVRVIKLEGNTLKRYEYIEKKGKGGLIVWLRGQGK